MLPPTRLLWRDGKGLAIHDGVRVELRQCPFPPPATECDLAMHDETFSVALCAIVRDGTEAWRDMQPGEVQWALTLLDRVAHAARAMLPVK